MTDPCPNIVTVGELIQRLSEFPSAAEVTFGCTQTGVPLCYYRVKSRHSDDLVIQIELQELHD